MDLRVIHTTRYVYAGEASLSQTEVHLRPRDCSHQVVHAWELEIDPEPEHVGERVDYFGNHVAFFTVHESHRELRIASRSLVTVEPTTLALQVPSWEEVRDHVRSDRRKPCLDAFQFAFPSPRARPADVFAEWALESFRPGRPILEAVAELNHRVHTDFAYEKGVTDVTTPVEEAFAQRRGVCQDFAHVMIACLRSIGLPARYVSGYLQTTRAPGLPRLVGSDESHAWVSVYALGQGWVDFDPTNDLVPSTRHVTVAWGRDYADVTPVKGVTLGGGDHTVEVSVDVESDKIKITS
jgi:transglutaminase-like putative cysteine protease